MSHYLLATGSTRPLAPHGYTVSSLLTKRARENTTPVALSYTFLLPFLMHVNLKLEEHIKDAEETGNLEEDLVQDLKDALKIAGTRFADNACRLLVTGSVSALLVYQDKPLGHSIVHAFDSYQRLHNEYYGRILATLRLPKGWAGIVGPAARPDDVAHFEHRPLTATAALEDSVKRQCLTAVAELTVGSVTTVLAHRGKAKDPDAPKEGLAKKLAVHTATVAARVAGAACGAALGSRCGAGGWEYWGECIGMMAATTGVALVYKRKVEQAKALHARPASTC